MSMGKFVTVGDHTIVRICGKFYLLLEIEVDFRQVKKEECVFIRISEQEARTLMEAEE
ncbi:hypothetical protein ACFVHQ_12775 [Actinomycetes bacterium NPDC127524]|uniref:hypothetical protein n=1 Tax=Peribacillus sp. B-H-3 TaxID=3400420 RepID=UPI003634DD42